MRTIGDDERRARLARRQHLAPSCRGDDVALIAGDVAGLHATDPATVLLAARARLRDVTPAAIEHALYVERSLVRLLGMRRTMFVVPVDLAAVVQASSTRALVPRERRISIGLLESSGVTDDGERWLAEAQEATLRALAARGEAQASELSQDVPALREKVGVATDKPYGAMQAMTTRVLFLLAAEGRIVRGRPRGSWTSSLYRWAPIDTWLPGGLPELDSDEAAAELVRRWLRAFGPGTYADLKWWTGWPAVLLRRALAQVGPVEVALDGGATALVLADDEEPVPAPDEPWVALLPALDPAPMGWQARDWYLGAHRERLFDRSGNIGPSVWCDGRIVGGWAQRKDGEIALALLEDPGADAAAAITTEAQRLREWIADVRVTPRFRTPLERELCEA
ncbi:MAG: hypothetical protein QOE31_704 [Solirubrobacteraceae bacterium]|nr:hypothetical protein [Solirubrobacteraceae bacterium]